MSKIGNTTEFGPINKSFLLQIPRPPFYKQFQHKNVLKVDLKFISTQIISFVIAELSCFNTSNSSPAVLNIKIVQNAHLAMFTIDSLQEILVYVQCFKSISFGIFM